MAESKSHVDVVVILKTVVEPDNVGMCQRAMDFDLGIELLHISKPDIASYEQQTLVLAFFVLSEVFVTTLQARRVPRISLTSYTRAKPPCTSRSAERQWTIIGMVTDLAQKSHTMVLEHAVLVSNYLWW